MKDFKGKLDNRYIIASFAIHVFLVLSILFLASIVQMQSKFIVFGAHSKKPTFAFYKSMKVPAVAPNVVSAAKQTPVKPSAKEKQVKKIAKKMSKPKPPKKKAAVEKPLPQVKSNIAPLKEKPKVKKVAKAKHPKKIEPVTKKDAVKQSEYIEKIKPAEEENKKLVEEKTAEKETVKEPDEVLQFDISNLAELQFAKYQKNIQDEVARLWQPPVGVSKGTECIVKFCVNKIGNVEKFEFQERSNVLLYDLSVVRISKEFKFDKFLWGKTFSITFRQ
jgi:hypothetical protein